MIPNNLKPDETVAPDNVSKDDLVRTLENLAKSERSKRDLMVELKGGLKRPHWSRRSNAPYYREKYAIIARTIMDRIVKTKRQQMFYLKDFPGEKSSTIKLRWYQGKMYLMDYLDPDGTYAAINQIVYCEVERGVGVKITLRNDLIDDAKADPEAMLPKEIMNNSEEWRSKIDSYLTNDNETDALILEDCALSNQEMEQLEVELGGLINISYIIRHDRIKIVKIPQ